MNSKWFIGAGAAASGQYLALVVLLLSGVLNAAYLMDTRVKNALNYPGQLALTPNRGGFGAEELVIEMMQKPKRYRDL